MQTTGIFTVHEYSVKAEKSGEPIYLIPFGDIHRSSPMCHEGKWLEFLDWAKTKKRAYFLGMGDYDDLASASERKILADKNLHESTAKTFTKMYEGHVKRLVKELKFMDGRLIGMLEGNHYAEFPDGTTTTQRLCRELNTKYLGVSSFVRFVIKYGKASANCLDIWAHHGKGGARLIGGSLNRVQQMAESAHADIYLMGHDHKKSVGMMDKLELSGGGGSLRLHHRKQLYIRTGSFLKGYENNSASYVTDMALNPTNLGVVKIEITPKKSGNSFKLDLHASI